MSLDAWLTLSILTSILVLLISTRIPAVVIFISGLTATLTLRLAPVEDILSGFSNPAMLTIAALYMVAAGMYSTGAINFLADKFIGMPNDLDSAKLKILPPVALSSAFLNNTPIVAMLIPIIRDICRIRQLSIKQLLIPLSYASILGGACTLIGTSSNLVMAGMISDLLENGPANLPTIRPLTMFDPAKVAFPALLLGLGFLYYFAKWLLPQDDSRSEPSRSRKSYCSEFVVEENYRLNGMRLSDAGLESSRGFKLVAIDRPEGRSPKIGPNTILRGGDILRFRSTINILPQLWQTIGLTPLHSKMQLTSKRYEHHLVEVVLSTKAPAIGHQIKDLPLPDTPYRIWLVGISRTGKTLEGPMDDIRLEVGDNLVLEVEESFFYDTQGEERISLMRRIHGASIQRIHKAATALTITAFMVVAATFGWMSMLNAALLATGAMIVTGCLTLPRAAKSINLSTLIIIACAIGLKSSLTHSGLADIFAHGLETIGGRNPYVALAAAYMGAAMMSNLIAVTAAVAFMFPLGIALATNLDLNFMPFAMTIMMGSAASYMTPTGYQTNLMVYEPGGYKFTDYLKVGFPMVLIVGLTTIFLSPLIFGF